MMLLRAWARDGWSNDKIARVKIGVNPDTLYTWINRFPEIADALSRGKEPYDVEVENKLRDSCLGFFVTVKEPIKLKTVKQKAGEGRIEEERIEYADRQIYVPPNVVAQKYWLSNRRPNTWREKREVVADVGDNAFKNMQTIAALINNPEPDIDIEDITTADSTETAGDSE